MQVKELMTRDVIQVSPQEMTSVAARMLSRYNVGALPVCGADGRLNGLITDRDIVLRCVAAEREPAKTPVGEIMTSRVVSVAPTESVERAAELMAREQVRRLPVAQDGKLVGVLSLGDLSVNQMLRMEASACLGEICNNVKRR